MPVSFDVSIIICTRNRAKSLRETLCSIGAAVLPEGTTAELLVVDNGSTDETRRVVEEANTGDIPLRYLHECRRGKVHALNRGITECRSEIAAFTDDDVCVSRDWVARLLSAYEDDEVSAVQGRVKVAWDNPLPKWFDPAQHGNPAEVDAGNERIKPYREPLVGANMSFRRKVAEKIGLFNTLLGPGRLGLWDDTEFSHRLIKAGFVQAYEPGVAVTHHPDPTRMELKAFKRSLWEFGRSAYAAECYGAVTTRPHPYFHFAMSSVRRMRRNMRRLLGRNFREFEQQEMFYIMERGNLCARMKGLTAIGAELGEPLEQPPPFAVVRNEMIAHEAREMTA
jgi:glycosyltransferase involved in cell wall biosynthesis